MDSHDEEHAAKLLRAQTHIWNHIFSFINSMSLKCVVDLGIPDIIHNYGQPMPLSNLIASLPIHPSKTCQLLPIYNNKFIYVFFFLILFNLNPKSLLLN